MFSYIFSPPSTTFLVYMRVLAVDVILNRSRPLSLIYSPLSNIDAMERTGGRNWPSPPFLFYFIFAHSEIAVEKIIFCRKKLKKKKVQLFISYPFFSPHLQYAYTV